MFGASHITVGVTLGLIADAHGHLGEYQKQKEASEKAVQIEEDVFGAGSPKLCSTLSTLAAAHRNLGNFRCQKEILTQVLHIDTAAFGAQHIDTAATMAAWTHRASTQEHCAEFNCAWLCGPGEFGRCRRQPGQLPGTTCPNGLLTSCRMSEV